MPPGVSVCDSSQFVVEYGGVALEWRTINLPWEIGLDRVSRDLHNPRLLVAKLWSGAAFDCRPDLLRCNGLRVIENCPFRKKTDHEWSVAISGGPIECFAFYNGEMIRDEDLR